MLRPPAGSSTVIAGMVTVVSQALLAVLTTRWLNPGDRGSLLLGMTTGGLVTVFASMGFTVTSRSGLAQGSLTTREFVATAQAAVLISVPMGVLAGVAVAPATVLPFVAFVPFVVCYGAANLTSFLFREAAMGLGRVERAMLVESATGVAQLLAIVGLQLTGILTLPSAMVSVMLLGIAGAAAQVLLAPLGRDAISRASKADFRRLVASRHSLAFFAAEYALTRWDRLIVGLLLGSDAVAFYGAAATYGQLGAIPVYGARQVFYRRISAGGSASSIMRATLGLAIVAGLGSAVVAPVFVPLLFGQEFSVIVGAAALSCLAGPALVLYQFRRSAAAFAVDNRRAAAASVVGLGVFAASCWPAYQALSWVGLVLAWLAATLVATVLIGRRRRS